MGTSYRWGQSWVVQAAAYAVARAIVTVVCMFSPRFGKRIGRLLGRLMYGVDAKHRRIATKNVAAAEGTPKEPHAVARFVRRVYEHLGISLVENLMLPKMIHGGGLLENTRLERFDIVDRALAAGRGCIVVIGHLGNWEWGGLAVAMSGYPLNSLARPIENVFLDRYITRFRTITGQRIIPKYNAIRAMVDVLKRNGMLVIQVDQDARHAGLIVPFLGRPASTVKSPALLALRHAAPILPVNVWRDGEGVHHVRITEPLAVGTYASTEESVRALTAAMNARLEEFVREHPTQWMWLHARWRTAGRVLRARAEEQSEETELSASAE